MPGRTQLGDLERSVMETLWDTGDDGWLTVREVHEVLLRRRDLAYTTVMTVLDRMGRKGLVARELEGRAWRYRPARSRGEMTAEVMRQALDELAGADDEDGHGDRAAALLAFVGAATATDRTALREALAAPERPSSG